MTRNRAAFSLRELIIVLAIIAVLMGFLGRAVYNARIAAERTSDL